MSLFGPDTVEVGSPIFVQISEGVWRPAIVVNLFPSLNDDPPLVNCVVFVDGLNDIPNPSNAHNRIQLVDWHTSIKFGDEVGQWQMTLPQEESA